jgi:glyoxylase-like metal-dependent hydrolase (beta-lactamase superfamily II)
LSAPASSSTPEDAFAHAAAVGIHRLSIPTPFAVGRVNCYLLEDEPLTLIDTGPNSGKSLDELERALAEHGHRIEQLGMIVITHQHMDHIGLLEILARRSGAEVAAIELLGPYLANFRANAIADDEFAQDVMRRHGIPVDLATVLGAMSAAFRAFGSGAPVTRQLGDGEELILRDRRLQALHRPGHSPSDTVFWDAARGILIAGDHLLASISSNPLVSRPLDGGAVTPQSGGAVTPQSGSSAQEPRPRALISYIDSLLATRDIPAELVLSGHGPPIIDHVRLIDERLRLHRRRASKILRLLDGGPLTAYEMAVKLWGNVAVTQAYLTLSEVLGHLDLLVREGLVREQPGEEIIRFEAIPLSEAIGSHE